MAAETRVVYEFDRYRLDPSRYLLIKEGQPITVTPKQFEILLILVENPGKILRKEHLLKSVWPDSFVEENNLSQNIFHLRRILDQSESNEGLIQTVPRVGYRFVASVRKLDGSSEQGDPREGQDVVTRNVPTAEVSSSRSYWLVLSVGVVAGILAGAIGWRLGFYRHRLASAPIIRFQMKVRDGESLIAGNLSGIAFSSDGSRVVYAARADGRDQLFLRAMDTEEITPVPGVALMLDKSS